MASAIGIVVALGAAAILTAMLSDGPASTAVTSTRSAARVWVPDSPLAVVLEFDRADNTIDRLTDLRKSLRRQPDDSKAAARYAELALQHYAATGDARFLGYAEGALSHWQANRSPPDEIWILRGRVLQSQHRFSEAAQDLDRLLRHRPGFVEASLLSADAWRRAGDIDKARSRCATLVLTGQMALARYCAAEILLSLGEPEKALQLASVGETSAGRTASGESATVRWTLSIKADAAAAAGDFRLAESLYEEALTLPGAPLALHVAYADLLLSANRPHDALDALADRPAADAVLLRRAIAAKKLGQPELDRYRSRLRQGFSDAQALGADALHLRERAMFELHVERDAAAALAFAIDNWAIQKGPEDAQILIDSATAAGSPDAASSVSDWRRRYDADGD